MGSETCLPLDLSPLYLLQGALVERGAQVGFNRRY